MAPLSPSSTLSDISVLKLKVDKCSRQDTVFMKKVSDCGLEVQRIPGQPRGPWPSGAHVTVDLCP